MHRRLPPSRRDCVTSAHIPAAARLDDLLVPSGNRLEALEGRQAGRYNIRFNDQYRVTFRWENGHAYEYAAQIPRSR